MQMQDLNRAERSSSFNIKSCITFMKIFEKNVQKKEEFSLSNYFANDSYRQTWLINKS